VAARFASIDDYIGSFPDETAVVLSELRRVAHRGVPGAREAITYDIPTLTLEGRNVIHFAAWKQHVSVYPVPAGDDAYERRVAPYRSGKGTAKFPLDQPVPYDLVEQMAELLARG
jgi:uncharacterized protein YdhG (YjbR/CyaY superfamily)